jgi:signal peptidase I
MGYNSGSTSIHSRPGQNWVSDLILECEVTVEPSEGVFALELSKGPDRFQAQWDVSSGTCTLNRVTDGRITELARRPTSLKAGGTYRVRFANVDDRLTVWVDRRLPFDDGVEYEPTLAKDFGPVEANDLRRPASIGVSKAAVSVRRVKLFRDTYYTVVPGGNRPDADSVDWSDPEQWKSLSGDAMPAKTIYVQPGHYLCLGDNSPESSDGRSWGLVPERLMLGRALFVYWPLNRVGRIR